MLTRAVARQVADQTHPFATCRATQDRAASCSVLELNYLISLQLPLVSHTTISPKLSFAFSLTFQFLLRAPVLIRTTLKALSLFLRKELRASDCPSNLFCNALVSVLTVRQSQCTGNWANPFRGYAVFVPMVCHQNDPGGRAILMELCF